MLSDAEETTIRRKAIGAKARWRLALAGLVVCVGVVAITPSFAFDSDHDGVSDSVEVYELGTDPSSADTFGKSIVGDNERRR